jgi:uncharacterized protein
MQRFLPGRHLIDSFGNGGFRLGGVSHLGSLLVTPSGARALAVEAVKNLRPEHLATIIAEKSDIDIVLIGTGHDMLPLPTSVMDSLRDQGIGHDVMGTNAAVRTYNVVFEEDRRVAAILIAVDKAHA